MVENNNNLSYTQQRGGILETLVLTLAPLLAWLLTKCVLCTALVVAYLLMVRFILNRKETLKAKLTKAGKGLIAVLTIFTALFIFLHTFVLNAKDYDTNKEPETVETQHEEQKEEEVTEDDKTEETSNQAVDPNGRMVKGTRTFDAHGAYTNPDGSLKDKITATKEANDPTKNAPKAETTTGKTENTIVDTTNAKADEKTEKVIEEAKKDDTKKVEDYKSDIVVITTPAVPQTTISENKPANPEKDIVVKQEEIKDLTPVENTPEETTISNEVEDDKVVEMDKDELAEVFKNVKKEEKSEKTAPKKEKVKEDVETKTDAVVKTEEVVEETIVNEEAKGNVKVEEAVKTETPVVEEKVEVKSVEAVKVTAIDGYNATVGSTIQFKVSGDDVKIDGLDGINYTFNNGILSVNTGSEATVLTVEASNSVNTVSFDITINGIAQ
jgi:hypothetical protein